MESEDIKVLVVTERKDDALLLEDILSNEGYKVYLVSQPKDLPTILKTNLFCAVLTDLSVGNLSAIDVANTVWHANKNIGVLAMVSYQSIKLAVTVMTEGIYGYVTKPLNAAEVKVVTKRAIEWYSLKSACEEKSDYLELSVQDGLTGVYNRRMFNAFLKNKVDTCLKTREKFSLIMIDIDHFKKYNDTNGHQAGDKLLKDLSKVFQDFMRDGDAVFRYGGEEFAVYLNNTPKSTAMMFAERLRSGVSLFVPATISLGVATFIDDSDDMTKLIYMADAALYCSKSTGRNRATAASPELKTEHS